MGTGLLKIDLSEESGKPVKGLIRLVPQTPPGPPMEIPIPTPGQEIPAGRYEVSYRPPSGYKVSADSVLPSTITVREGADTALRIVLRKPSVVIRGNILLVKQATGLVPVEDVPEDKAARKQAIKEALKNALKEALKEMLSKGELEGFFLKEKKFTGKIGDYVESYDVLGDEVVEEQGKRMRRITLRTQLKRNPILTDCLIEEILQGYNRPRMMILAKPWTDFTARAEGALLEVFTARNFPMVSPDAAARVRENEHMMAEVERGDPKTLAAIQKESDAEIIILISTKSSVTQPFPGTEIYSGTCTVDTRVYSASTGKYLASLTESRGATTQKPGVPAPDPTQARLKAITKACEDLAPRIMRSILSRMVGLREIYLSVWGIDFRGARDLLRYMGTIPGVQAGSVSLQNWSGQRAKIIFRYDGSPLFLLEGLDQRQIGPNRLHLKSFDFNSVFMEAKRVP
jgi:hypothetical protein